MPEEVAQSPQNGIRRTAEAVRLIYLYAVNILMRNCVRVLYSLYYILFKKAYIGECYQSRKEAQTDCFCLFILISCFLKKLALKMCVWE